LTNENSEKIGCCIKESVASEEILNSKINIYFEIND